MALIEMYLVVLVGQDRPLPVAELIVIRHTQKRIRAANRNFA